MFTLNEVRILTLQGTISESCGHGKCCGGERRLRGLTLNPRKVRKIRDRGIGLTGSVKNGIVAVFIPTFLRYRAPSILVKGALHA